MTLSLEVKTAATIGNRSSCGAKQEGSKRLVLCLQLWQNVSEVLTALIKPEQLLNLHKYSHRRKQHTLSASSFHPEETSGKHEGREEVDRLSALSLFQPPDVEASSCSCRSFISHLFKSLVSFAFSPGGCFILLHTQDFSVCFWLFSRILCVHDFLLLNKTFYFERFTLKYVLHLFMIDSFFTYKRCSLQ